jgi:hypothetical protein
MAAASGDISSRSIAKKREDTIHNQNCCKIGSMQGVLTAAAAFQKVVQSMGTTGNMQEAREMVAIVVLLACAGAISAENDCISECKQQYISYNCPPAPFGWDCKRYCQENYQQVPDQAPPYRSIGECIRQYCDPNPPLSCEEFWTQVAKEQCQLCQQCQCR